MICSRLNFLPTETSCIHSKPSLKIIELLKMKLLRGSCDKLYITMHCGTAFHYFTFLYSSTDTNHGLIAKLSQFSCTACIFYFNLCDQALRSVVLPTFSNNRKYLISTDLPFSYKVKLP